MSNTPNYGNDSISLLRGADRVRLRPGVIFGSDGLEGCEHSFFEILSNSVDEAREGHGNEIKVTVFNDKSKADVYLPAGKWVNYFTHEVYEGGRWITLRDIPYDEIPCFVRAGAVIAHGYTDERPDYDYTKDAKLYVYGAECVSEGEVDRQSKGCFKEKEVVIYKPDGESFVTVRVLIEDGRITNDAGYEIVEAKAR